MIHIDINKQLLQSCINQRIASIRRQQQKENNPLIKDLLGKDIDVLIKADLTIKEVK